MIAFGTACNYPKLLWSVYTKIRSSAALGMIESGYFFLNLKVSTFWAETGTHTNWIHYLTAFHFSGEVLDLSAIGTGLSLHYQMSLGPHFDPALERASKPELQVGQMIEVSMLILPGLEAFPSLTGTAHQFGNGFIVAWENTFDDPCILRWKSWPKSLNRWHELYRKRT